MKLDIYNGKQPMLKKKKKTYVRTLCMLICFINCAGVVLSEIDSNIAQP